MMRRWVDLSKSHCVTWILESPELGLRAPFDVCSLDRIEIARDKSDIAIVISRRAEIRKRRRRSTDLEA